MNSYVLDTMALVLFLEGRRVPSAVKEIFKEFRQGQVRFVVPAMVLVELSYLTEKNRISASLSDVESICTSSGCHLLPMNLNSIKRAFEIQDIPELHDRLIAGAASEQSLPLISNDPVIQASLAVKTIW